MEDAVAKSQGSGMDLLWNGGYVKRIDTYRLPRMRLRRSLKNSKFLEKESTVRKEVSYAGDRAIVNP